MVVFAVFVTLVVIDEYFTFLSFQPGMTNAVTVCCTVCPRFPVLASSHGSYSCWDWGASRAAFSLVYRRHVTYSIMTNCKYTEPFKYQIASSQNYIGLLSAIGASSFVSMSSTCIGLDVTRSTRYLAGCRI